MDENALFHLVDCLTDGLLEQLSTGPDCVLKLSRQLSLLPKEDSRAYQNWEKGVTRFATGELIHQFRSRGGSRYFESLDEAFRRAPELQDGCAWVFVRDCFCLTNVGILSEGKSPGVSAMYGALSRSYLKDEQRLIFEQPLPDNYTYRDNYFQSVKRSWRSKMVVPGSRFPGIRPPRFCDWVEMSRAIMHSKGVVRLTVLGAYFRTGVSVQIVPFWIRGPRFMESDQFMAL